jgi:hypothetical protein
VVPCFQTKFQAFDKQQKDSSEAQKCRIHNDILMANTCTHEIEEPVMTNLLIMID